MWKPTGELVSSIPSVPPIPVQRIADGKIKGGKREGVFWITRQGKKVRPGNFYYSGSLDADGKRPRYRRTYRAYDDEEKRQATIAGNTDASYLPFNLVRLALASMVPGICFAQDEFGNVANWKGGMTVQLCVAHKTGPRTLRVEIPESFPMLTVEIDGPRLDPKLEQEQIQWLSPSPQ